MFSNLKYEREISLYILVFAILHSSVLFTLNSFGETIYNIVNYCSLGLYETHRRLATSTCDHMQDDFF